MTAMHINFHLIYVIAIYILSGNSQKANDDLDIFKIYGPDISESIIFTEERQEGARCTLKNGEMGICTSINECGKKIKLNESKDPPTICEIQGQNVSICCPPVELKPTTVQPLIENKTSSVLKYIRNIICTKKNGIRGLCRPISDCEDDPEEVLQTGNLEICDFSENDECPNICCENPYLRPGEDSTYFREIKPYNTRKYKNESVEFLFESMCNATYYSFIRPWQIRRVVEKPRNDTCYPRRVYYAAGYGGTDAPPYKYRHMAALGFDTPEGVKYLCGGTLITTKLVLTAAHCLWSKQYGPIMHARFGIVNIHEDKDYTKQDRTIIRRVKHPDYHPKRKYHDIAIVELNERVYISLNVVPACLDTGRLKPNTELTATGWGKIGFTGAPADHLQELFIRIYNYSECQKFYSPTKSTPQGIVDDWQICAGKLNVDTCEGDSGGPLQYSLKNYKYFTDGFLITGVTSFGKPCALTESPGIYTRVSAYLDWIASVIFT